MKPSRSVCPAAALRAGCGSPAENSYPLPQLTVNGAPAPCVTWKTTCCPAVGLIGLPIVRLPATVTRKSLPSEASTAIVAASASVTTVGATAPGSTVVACASSTACRAAPACPTAPACPDSAVLPEARAGDAAACASAAPPAAPTAAAPTAPLKTFRRLTASPEPDDPRRAHDCLPNKAPPSLTGLPTVPAPR